MVPEKTSEEQGWIGKTNAQELLIGSRDALTMPI